MKAISVKETSKLKGTIEIQGSKNTVLPIMASSLLASGSMVITNCPDIEDVHVMCQLLKCLHVKTYYKNHTLEIDTRQATYAMLPAELTGKLRSSVLLLGPMLAKWQRAQIGMPGGCAIGLRPIDIHLEGFMRMNVDVKLHHDILCCETYYLQGTDYTLHFPSVGATQNLIMAAVGAKGRTVLRGVAREPEVVELCKHLKHMGVIIEGVGTDVLTIKGSSSVSCHDYQNVYDRIVAGTYILMATCISSRIYLKQIDDIESLKTILQVANQLGANIVRMEQMLCIESDGVVGNGNFETGGFPAFPTDLQPVLMTVLTKSEKDSSLMEHVFEKRLGIAQDLNQLGASIRVNGREAKIEGGNSLTGHTVRATDLRQGAALVVAGLMSKGYTTITDISHIERGYEDIVGDLRKVGADISYV
ncbi:MAG: UDP-N-acetylglucosamine 1-carboxyvinyltransferase [Eubacteriales bacterium]|nr:UDP-N-acetylglucosamine 1-carboxyvinyltransferase [Eubacteriales bacterium]